MGYDTRVLTAEEIDIAADWAAAEGWNPGHHDATCFQSVDADGFWGGFLDGQMIACISVVNYDADFAFLGVYITQPAYRGQGYGYTLWQAALAHAGTRIVGLDGVPDEQENYRKSGFVLAWQNSRFGGVVTPAAPSVDLRPITAPDAALEALDAKVFPTPRPAFWQSWLSAPGHHALAAHSEGQMQGFGVIRPCRDGWKIGPLVAQTPEIADALLHGLAHATGEATPQIFLDLPTANRDAVALAEGLGLVPVFETARMYKGPVPQVDLSLIYSVTSYELG